MCLKFTSALDIIETLRRCYIDLKDIILNMATEMCDETLAILRGVFLKAEGIYYVAKCTHSRTILDLSLVCIYLETHKTNEKNALNIKRAFQFSAQFLFLNIFASTNI